MQNAKAHAPYRNLEAASIRLARRDQTCRLDGRRMGPRLFARAMARPQIVVHDEVIDAAELQALVAGNRQGLATYRLHGHDAELVTLDAVPAGAGIGTALIEALTIRLRAEGCARLWLTMTNDKLPALRFYLRRGFRLIQVRLDAVDDARRLKPSIPMTGEHGIPMRDELDLCRILDPSIGRQEPGLPPWSQR